jgi:hypothetical protein
MLSLAVCSTQLLAEQHIVAPTELQQRLRSAADDRKQKLARFNDFLSKDEVRNALQSAKIDTNQVKQAAALLTDEELASLSARSGQIERDIAAGSLTNQQLTYIVIALATAVIVIILI